MIRDNKLADGAIDHSLGVTLVDPKGRILLRYAGANIEPARILRDVRQFLAQTER